MERCFVLIQNHILHQLVLLDQALLTYLLNLLSVYDPLVPGVSFNTSIKSLRLGTEDHLDIISSPNTLQVRFTSEFTQFFLNMFTESN